MHLSQDTYNQIASLLQAGAKQFRKQKLMESIVFKQTPNLITITMDNMGIGKLVAMGEDFLFTSHSALGEKFNGTRYRSIQECKDDLVSHMLGEKKEPVALSEETEELTEEVETLEEKYSDDDHVIMQMRKAQDVDGKLDIKFHSGPAGRLAPDQIKKILGVYDKLTPEGKRRMRVMMKTHKSTLDMLKEDVYNEDMEELDESTLSQMRDVEIASFYKKMKGIKGLEKVVAELKKEMDKRDLKEGTSYEKDMDPKKKVTVQGVKGMKSRPFKKTFPNMAAYEKWADSAAAEDVDVSRVFQEEAVYEHHIKPGTMVTAKKDGETIKGKVVSDTSEKDGTDEYQYILDVDGKEVSVSNKSIKEEAEELDESNTTPFFIDPKTKKAMPPKDEIAALEDYIKSSSKQSGSGSDQKLYVAKQRLQYLSARVVREETDCNDKDEKKSKKKGKKKDGEELDMDPKMTESFKDIIARRQLEENYKIYHPTYSAAVAEALAVVKKAGHTVDEDDFFNKITSGPRKPSSGKTNSASVALEGTKKVLHMQVYNTGKSFELNCYIQ